MVQRARSGTFLLLLAASLGSAAESGLLHRVWLLGGVPDPGTVSMLRDAGVSAFCVPVGRVEIGDGVSRFEADVPAGLDSLRGSTVSAVVWVEGDTERGGDPARFALQFAAVEGKLPGEGSVILAARRYGEGLPRFAGGVAKRLHRSVELALPLADLGAHLPAGGWKGVLPVAFALGNPSALGLPPSTVQDDREGLAGLDEHGARYRAAVVIAPRVSPPPGGRGVSLAALAAAGTSAYHPGSQGDVFVLQRTLDWGGVLLAPGQRVEVESFDTARYDRDLGALLRPLRPGFEGWDTVGLPAPEPAVGMSREAFLDYLGGGGPEPRPVVEASWTGNKLMLSLRNATPHGSAYSSSGTWVELQVAPGEVADVQLGEFTGLEFGRRDGGALRATVLREAAVLRFCLAYLEPRAQVGGASVSFFSRRSELRGRWQVRMGDGRDAGDSFRIDVTSP